MKITKLIKISKGMFKSVRRMTYVIKSASAF